MSPAFRRELEAMSLGELHELRDAINARLETRAEAARRQAHEILLKFIRNGSSRIDADRRP